MRSAAENLFFLSALQLLSVHANRPTAKLAQNALGTHSRSTASGSYISIGHCGAKIDTAPACEKLVRESLGAMNCTNAAELRTCMNRVLEPKAEGRAGREPSEATKTVPERDLNAEHASECCAKGTEFDSFLINEINGTSLKALDINKQTAILFVDIQKDFTVGSLAQPCWGSGGERFMQGIKKLIHLGNKRGATLIATKDFHPADHCSFAKQATCKNIKGDSPDMPDTDNELSGDGSRSYVNEFPPHASFTFVADKAFAKPQAAPDTAFCSEEYQLFGIEEGHFCKNKDFIGAAFDAEFAKALAEVNKSQVEVVFKGFNKDFESFSALPHFRSNKKESDADENEIKHTGAWALPVDRALNCHADWEADFCYPTKDMLEDPLKEGARPIVEILNTRSIEKLIVVGLVFDFSVKETAIFATEALQAKDGWAASFESASNGREVSVTVLGDLTRPAFDGKPGAPYNSGFCNGEHDGSFCTEGGGTAPTYKKILAEFGLNQVKLVRSVPQKCAPKSGALQRSGIHFFAGLVISLFISA